MKNRIIISVVLLLSGAAFMFIWLHFFNKTVTPEMTEYFTANGETRSVVLPDETEVFLNAGTILVYPKTFEKKVRRVYLCGEAVFTVSHHKEWPFIVNTQNISTITKNSTFLITAYPNGNTENVTPFKGDLQLYFNKKETVKDIPLNTRTEYSPLDNNVRQSKIDAYKSNLFKDGYLVFQSVTFEYIMNSIARHYNKNINYDSKKYKDRYFTITFFPQSDIQETLKVLGEMIPDFKYHIRENNIYIN